VPGESEKVTGCVARAGEVSLMVGKITFVGEMELGAHVICSMSLAVAAKVNVFDPDRAANTVAQLFAATWLIMPLPIRFPDAGVGPPPTVVHGLIVALISISSDVEVPPFFKGGMNPSAAPVHAPAQVVTPVPTGLGIAPAPLIGPASKATNNAELTTTNRRITVPLFRRTYLHWPTTVRGGVQVPLDLAAPRKPHLLAYGQRPNGAEVTSMREAARTLVGSGFGLPVNAVNEHTSLSATHGPVLRGWTWPASGSRWFALAAS
jgi:hypothetical protein